MKARMQHDPFARMPTLLDNISSSNNYILIAPAGVRELQACSAYKVYVPGWLA